MGERHRARRAADKREARKLGITGRRCSWLTKSEDRRQSLQTHAFLMRMAAELRPAFEDQVLRMLTEQIATDMENNLFRDLVKEIA